MGLVLKNALFDQLGPQPPEEIPPELTQAPIAAQAFQNPYTPALAAVRKRLLDLDAQQNQPMYSPDELAARNQGSKRDEAYGMLAALSGDPGLSEVGGQLLKTALAGRQRKQTEHGEYDPATGAFKYFPEYQRQQQRTALTGEAGRLEAAEAAAQTQQLARQETLADRQEGRRSTQAFQENQAQMNRDLRRELGDASRANAASNQGGVQEQRMFQREQALNSDYEKATKTIGDEVHAADSLMRLSAKGAAAMTAAEQQALIYSFMKMLDPTSVVRESEYASAARARGVFDAAGNYLNQLQSGKMLTPDQVHNLYNIGMDYKRAAMGLKTSIDKTFVDRAQRWGVEPSGVTRTMGQQPPDKSAGPPTIGTEEHPLVIDRRKPSAGKIIELPY